MNTVREFDKNEVRTQEFDVKTWIFTHVFDVESAHVPVKPKLTDLVMFQKIVFTKSAWLATITSRPSFAKLVLLLSRTWL